MELWTFRRFQQPRLSVDSVEHDAGTAVVRLQAGARTYRLALDDDGAAAELAEDLRSLGDCGAPLWTTLRESSGDSGWFALASFLDSRSLIAEGRDGAAGQLAIQAERIRACAERTAGELLRTLSPGRRAMVASHASRLRRDLGRAPAARPQFEPGGDPFDPAVEPNFFLALLRVELEYFRRSSPLTLAAAGVLLATLANEPSFDRDSWSDVAGVYDERDLSTHLWLVAHLLGSSTGTAASRFVCAPLPALAPSSGLEFVRRAELLMRATAAQWEDVPFPAGAARSLVTGRIVEQYHVTTRFVEIVAPLLRVRLAAPLRGMMFQYFLEEYGHEELERQTCASLGVSEETLAKTVPLPLHYTLVDALTLIADVDPISFCAAVMVIEGLFGEPPGMVLEAPDGASREHEELNASLNHNSLARDLFEPVAAIGPARQALAMQRVLFLLELNHRAWAAVAEFYGSQDELRLHGGFGQPLIPE